MNKQYLQEIKDRAESATEGPWDWNCGGLENEDMDIPVLLISDYEYEISKKDRAFIINAREDIPALVAEVEKNAQEIIILKKALEMMYQDNKQYNPDGMGNPLWYIKQAQEEDKMNKTENKI